MRSFDYLDDEGNIQHGEIDVIVLDDGIIHEVYPNGWHRFVRADGTEIIRIYLPNHLTIEERCEAVEILIDRSFELLKPLSPPS